MERLATFAKAVTVEPVLLMFMTAIFMQHVSYQSYVYRRVCVGIYSDEVCNNITLPQYSSGFSAVQRYASHWLLAGNVVFCAGATVAALWLGAFSDTGGRKRALVVPTLGHLFGTAWLVVFSTMAPAAPLALQLLVFNAITGLSGGFTGLLLAVTAYLADVTSAASRTVRLSLLESCTLLGALFGPLLAVQLQLLFGIAASFAFQAVIHLLVLFYIWLLVPQVAAEAAAAVAEQSGAPSHSCTLASCLQVMRFGVGKLSRTLSLVCLPGLRRQIWLLLLSFLVITSNTIGEMNASYLFVKDLNLSKSDVLYGDYFSCKFALSALSLIAVLPLLRRFCRVSDLTLCAIGLVSKAAGLVWLGLAVNVYMLFTTPFLLMLSVFCVPPIRSMVTKLVKPHEHGRAVSLLSIVENSSTLLGSLFYNAIYPATRQTSVRGLVFILGAFTLSVPALLLVLLSNSLRQQGRNFHDTDPLVESEDSELETRDEIDTVNATDHNQSRATVDPDVNVHVMITG